MPQTMQKMLIRPFNSQDSEAVARLFHDTIHRVNAADYSPEQLKAWAPADIHFKDWKAACTETYTAVCHPEGAETVTGFGMLKDTGHVDCFYVHHLWQGRGIGRLIMEHLTSRALAQGADLMTSDVSITAVPFFRSCGFHILCEQQVSVRGATLTNFRMEKPLR